MDFKDVVFARRSIRRYRQEAVADDDLRQLIEFARVSPAATNAQRLRLTVIRNIELVEKIFALTRWAGAVAPRRTPVWGKDAPLCFIAFTAKKEQLNSSLYADAGAVAQNLMLGAVELGLGSCWIGSFDKEAAHGLLELAEDTEVFYLISVGYPAETPVWEDASDPEHVKYYLDENDLLHVPKLTADDLACWK
jgi:nitroreductase